MVNIVETCLLVLRVSGVILKFMICLIKNNYAMAGVELDEGDTLVILLSCWDYLIYCEVVFSGGVVVGDLEILGCRCLLGCYLLCYPHIFIISPLPCPYIPSP